MRQLLQNLEILDDFDVLRVVANGVRLEEFIVVRGLGGGLSLGFLAVTNLAFHGGGRRLLRRLRLRPIVSAGYEDFSEEGDRDAGAGRALNGSPRTGVDVWWGCTSGISGMGREGKEW